MNQVSGQIQVRQTKRKSRLILYKKQKASSVALSHMVCDVSTRHIGYYMSAADQLSVFVLTQRQNKDKI